MPPRLLRLTHPFMHGPDVRAVQARLTALGFDPGEIDGVYGPETESAVRAFQVARGLEVDGVVGPETRAALAGTRPRPSGGAIGRRALAEARRHLGVEEHPPGSNRTPFGVWFGENGVPWCNIFVSYCFRVGAEYTICADYDGPGCSPRGCAYVPTTEAWLQATGMWLGGEPPEPGDLVIYDFDGGEPDHIGIVERVDSDSFTAIEGNTALGNDSNGGRVMRRERDMGVVEGFGRVTR